MNSNAIKISGLCFVSDEQILEPQIDKIGATHEATTFWLFLKNYDKIIDTSYSEVVLLLDNELECSDGITSFIVLPSACMCVYIYDHNNVVRSQVSTLPRKPSLKSQLIAMRQTSFCGVILEQSYPWIVAPTTKCHRAVLNKPENKQNHNVNSGIPMCSNARLFKGARTKLENSIGAMVSSACIYLKTIPCFTLLHC